MEMYATIVYVISHLLKKERLAVKDKLLKLHSAV